METKPRKHVAGQRKSSMQVEGFEVSAWKDRDGLIRMEIQSLDGREVLLVPNHPWTETGAGDVLRCMFTSNRNIIDEINSPMTSNALKEAAGDRTFRAWYIAEHLGRSPEEAAEILEKTSSGKIRISR